MVVDDDPGQVEYLSHVLRGNGFDVIVFDDPHEALQAIRQENAIDLVITDLRMPRIDGLEFTGMLRKAYPAMPVIMLTADPSVEAFFKAFGLGVQDFINKPVKESDVIRAVNAFLNKAA
jgi:CheY-like chemotaxis protein